MLGLIVAVVVASVMSDVLDRAARRSNCSHKEIALAMGLSPSQWSRQLHGERHVALDLIALAPAPFRAALADELESLWSAPPLTAREVLAIVMARLAPKEGGQTCA